MDPVLISIATAAAGKLAEEAARGIVAAGKFVKDRFAKDDAREAVLMRAETGRVPVADLAAVIEETCAADPAFLAELEALAGRSIHVTRVDQAGQRVMFQNNFYGDGPGKVVQGETVNIQRLD
ncbi:hypothetical protein SAMN05216298_4603 [Glycomyces sambucus]|uniref:Uncharacterized protein n=1 Tax=Glycomyces sambucus TaxID=380244 RepID=A0A1G9LM45_9ACTN|nr:hypothetical protein [Glycomyces sambucus]SDL62956.1 hypothetical protein SAMN05216298_4603 [Glycomyces sambucus]